MDNHTSMPDAYPQAIVDFSDDVDRIFESDMGKIMQDQFGGEQICGKIFATMDDAYAWYNEYALLKGFGTRIDYNRKSRKTKEIIRKRFVCNKEGLKVVNENGENKRRRDTRTGCGAYMEIKITEAKNWVICKFDDNHNHPLTTPSKVSKHRSHSLFHRSKTCKSLVGNLSNLGVRPCIISRTVNALNGNPENVVTPQQCSAIITTERQRNIGQECNGIIKHFHDKAASDDEHFFAVDIDEYGMLKSIFWADGRSRASYTQFGDVLVFDVTYKTNKFKMPFAPFVGVNHHRQSILFGGALLVDEKESTFTWLFEQFLKCMHNIAPLAIITDQDKAMGNAIKKIFSNARHRFCAWHINKHVVEHLASYRSQYSDFNERYRELIKSDSIEDFESKLDSFQNTFHIDTSSWLGNMFSLRRHWVKAYLKDCFFAGMTSSGRSESIHSFFDGYLNANTMLNDFVVQYDVAVKARREAENSEDFKTLNSTAALSTTYPIEEQVGKWYTRNVFNIFQVEWKKSFNLIDEKISKEGNVIKYIVGLPVVDKGKWRNLSYELIGDTFNAYCLCAKFETEGILCKHIVYIMRKKCVYVIPQHYLLDRWSIYARFQAQGVGCRANGNDISPLATWSIRSRFKKAIEDANCNPNLMKKLSDVIDDVIDEAAALNMSKPCEEIIIPTQGASPMGIFEIHDPIASIKCKGRPKAASRIKSGLEIGQQSKKQRTCGHCGGKGHYITGCAKRKAELPQDA